MPLLFMHYLKCDKTTEEGEDEVYFVVGTKHSNGKVSTFRLPSSKGHWDLNDGSNPNTTIANIAIAEFELAPKEHIDLVFNLHEEDGGMADEYMNQIGTLLESTQDPYATAVGGFAKLIAALFDFRDTDDWMGSFMVRVNRNEKGQYFASWQPIARIPVIDPAGRGQFYRAVLFSGDGSNYTGHFEIRNIQNP